MSCHGSTPRLLRGLTAVGVLHGDWSPIDRSRLAVMAARTGYVFLTGSGALDGR